jgi:hypothetical protein
MSQHPHTFSHSTNPLDDDDSLKVISKKLDIAQCNDRERVGMPTLSYLARVQE